MFPGLLSTSSGSDTDIGHTPPPTVSALHIKVPISYIMSSRIPAAPWIFQVADYSCCPVSLYLAVLSKILAEFGVLRLSHSNWRLVSDPGGTVRGRYLEGVRMAAPRLRSLPRNVTDITRVLTCVDGALQNLAVSPDVGRAI